MINVFISSQSATENYKAFGIKVPAGYGTERHGTEGTEMRTNYIASHDCRHL